MALSKAARAAPAATGCDPQSSATGEQQKFFRPLQLNTKPTFRSEQAVEAGGAAMTAGRKRLPNRRRSESSNLAGADLNYIAPEGTTALAAAMQRAPAA